MGVSYKEFWSLNPHILAVMERGYGERIKSQDRLYWLWSGYIHDAVCVALAKVMRGSKSAKMMDKPILKDYFDNLYLTEEEIMQREMDEFKQAFEGLQVDE